MNRRGAAGLPGTPMARGFAVPASRHLKNIVDTTADLARRR
jgi:hypothetical protein